LNAARARRTFDAVGERSTALESERLARQYFELFNARSIGRLAQLIHPDVVLELQAVDVGRVLRGRGELVRFFAEQFARRRWDAYLHAVHALDECKVIVEGRVRWIDDERVLRDSPRVWALEFCDGLLLRSIPARSVDDAHAILMPGAGSRESFDPARRDAEREAVARSRQSRSRD
jgi:SnoaL-like domain